MRYFFLARIRTVSNFTFNQGIQVSIVHYFEKVTLVGAGKAYNGDITEALTYAPRLVAADGGVKNAVKIGQMPDLVIGDMDSARKRDLAGLPPDRVVRIAEQDTTDFEKCLMTFSAPLILGVGFLGGRLDHELAALSVLVRYAAQPCILLSRTELCFHLATTLTLAVDPGTRLSLFPMARVSGRSTGLRWPIAGLDFAPDGRIGTSNAVEDTQVTLAMDGPGMLIILPRATLPQVIAALSP